ncbi:MAG: low temperature requirement protein A [Acidimicrobiia bacterium]|nr:low temperature requirement protein A [Acidimicrobiia bacterium]
MTQPAIDNELTVAPLELFFDLVFVFAITQIAALIHHDLSLLGVARGALVLAMLYWGWSLFTWTLNSVGTARLDVRLGLFTAMAMSLLMARVIPGAFGDEGLYFAGAYFVFRLIANVTAIRTENPETRTAQWTTFIPLTMVGSIVALAGGFVDDPWRSWIWLASLAIDLIAARAAQRADFHIQPRHFAERYGLLVIIALGESIVAIGAGLTEVDVDLTLGLTLIVAFAATATLWWSYFHWVADRVEHHLTALKGTERGAFARDAYTFLHYPLVTGIVLFAVAVEEIVVRPMEHAEVFTRALLASGFSLVLLSFVGSAYRALRLIPVLRLGAAGLVVVLSLVAWAIPGIWLLALNAGLILIMLMAESKLRGRTRLDEEEGANT